VGVVVQFDYATWAQIFPTFSNLTQQQIEGPVLTIAQQYCRNDGGGPVCDPGLQTQLLNLMVAHVAQLLFGSTTNPVSPIVGRISDATEGSVSVSSEFPVNAGNAWFVQTQWGAMYWQLILPYRLGRYIPKITPLVQPVDYSAGWFRS
jgi:hypothetical protein